MFGIDIGTTCLKAVRIGTSEGSRAIVEKAALRSLDENLLGGNFASLDIRDRNELKNELVKLVKEIGATGEKVAVSLPDQYVKLFFLNVDKLQDVTEDERRYTEWRLRKQLPGKVAENCVLDYQVLSTERNDEGLQIRLMVQIIKKSILNSFAELLVEAGTEPVFFNCDTLACYNLCHDLIRRTRESSGCSDTCLLHLGNDSTTFAFTRSETPEWIRILDYGCHNFTNTLKELFDLDSVQARRQISHEELIPGAAPKEADLVPQLARFHDIFEEWFREVGSTFSYYRSHFPCIGRPSVLLCGGGTVLRNLAPFLERLLELKVCLVQLDEVMIMPEGFDAADSMRLLPAVGIAMSAHFSDHKAIEEKASSLTIEAAKTTTLEKINKGGEAQ